MTSAEVTVAADSVSRFPTGEVIGGDTVSGAGKRQINASLLSANSATRDAKTRLQAAVYAARWRATVAESDSSM